MNDSEPILSVDDTVDPLSSTPLVARTNDDAVRQQLSAVTDQLSRLEEKFDERFTYDKIKDQQIKQLSELVETYKSGIAFPILRSFAREVHTIRESIARYIRSEALKDHSSVIREIELFVSELDEALQNQGFVILSSQPGAKFDASQHRASKPISVNDINMIGQIAASKKAGLLYQKADGTWITVAPELVDVFTSPPATTGATE